MIKEAYSLSVDFSDFLCLIHCLVCMGICFNMGKLKTFDVSGKVSFDSYPLYFPSLILKYLLHFMKTFAYHPLLICCQATSPMN